jgi:hypothetical protein
MMPFDSPFATPHAKNSIRYLGALVIVAILSACSPSSDWYDMRLLNDQVTGMVHDCVPLGWVPVRVNDDVFYPGYSVEIDETDWYLPPPWVGGFGPHPIIGKEGRIAADLLAHLVRAGIVSTHRVRGSTQYHLTGAGFERYFDNDAFGNNRLHSSYVCYSTISVQSIQWKQPVHLEADPYRPGRVQVFRVGFTWSTAHDPSWTPDAYLRAHTIALGPPRSPTIAKFILRGNFWELVNLYPAQSRIVDPSAWSSRPPLDRGS